MTQNLHNRFEELMSKLLEESILIAEFEELVELTEKEKSFRRSYMELTQLHATLLWEGENGDNGKQQNFTVGKKETRFRILNSPIFLVLTASILFVMVVSQVWNKGSEKEYSDLKFTRQVNCVWEGQDPTQNSVVFGKEIFLKEGIAELEFPHGETLTVYSPASFQIETRERCLIRHGNFSFQNTDDSPLVVGTPTIYSVRSEKDFLLNVPQDAAMKTAITILEGAAKILTKKESQQINVAENSIAFVDESGKIEVQQVEKQFLSIARSLPQMSAVLRKNLGKKNPGFAWRGRNGLWSDSSNWVSGNIPNNSSSVRISRGSNVSVRSNSEAGEIYIGWADLIINQSELHVGGLSGDLDIGFRPQGSRVEVNQGAMTVDGRVILRKETSFIQNGGRVKIGADLFFLDGGSTVRLNAGVGCEFVCRNLFGMKNNDIIELISGKISLPYLEVRNVAQVGGTLNLKFEKLINFPNHIILLDNQGKYLIQGHFENMKEGQMVAVGSHTYKFTYQFQNQGKENNDIALLLVK